jgi:ubiquinone/menaquinone biosynthesis C-methylase UbiE
MSDAAEAGAVAPSATSLDPGESKNGSARVFWRRYLRYYDSLLEAIPYRDMVEDYRDHLQPGAFDRILDAGTGTGNVATVLLSRGARVVGIDFCPEALERCRKKAPEGEFRFADLTEKLDFDSDDFDKIACCCVLHNLSRRDQDLAMMELHRVLKPGGLMALTVFATGFSRIKIYLESFRARWRGSDFGEAVLASLRFSLDTIRIVYYVGRIKRRDRSGEIHFFSRDELEELVERAGFELIALDPVLAGQAFTAVMRKPIQKPRQ